MTAAMQRRSQSQLVQSRPTRRRQRTKSKAIKVQKRKDSGSLVASSLKASLVGGFGILLLMLISLIPFQLLALLVIPGFLVVWLCTGMLASIIAGDKVQTSQDGGKVGWMAGFWSGIYGGLAAMILAATGIFMVNFGQGVAAQFPPDQLPLFLSSLSPDAIAITGRIFGALLIYGVIGSLVSGLFSSLGGMIYPKLAVATD